MSGRKLPRSFSAPVFQKNSRRIFNVLRYKIRDMRTAAVTSITCAMRPRERRRRSAENNRDPALSAPSLSPRLSPNEWQLAFDNLIFDEEGREAFMRFLQSEYSEENILFWWAAEQLKDVVKEGDRSKFEETVTEMYETFIATESPLAINIDHDTRKDIITRVENQDPSTYPDNIFEKAQAHVYRLMEKDCFGRFVHTAMYKEVAKKLSLPQTFRFNGRVSPNL